MECKSQKIEVLVAAANKYLGVQDFTSEGCVEWWCPDRVLNIGIGWWVYNG
jgi:hypothetical protein